MDQFKNLVEAEIVVVSKRRVELHLAKGHILNDKDEDVVRTFVVSCSEVRQNEYSDSVIRRYPDIGRSIYELMDEDTGETVPLSTWLERVKKKGSCSGLYIGMLEWGIGSNPDYSDSLLDLDKIIKYAHNSACQEAFYELMEKCPISIWGDN